MEKLQTGEKNSLKFEFLSANALKIIALVAMTIDHVGVIFFPSQIIWRIFGRLAFPLFAFFIAEGTKHTRNKLRYFLVIFALGVVCEIVARAFAHTTECNILLTFSISIGLVYALDWLKKSVSQGNPNHAVWASVVLVVAIGAAFVASHVLPQYISWFDGFDYGFFGIMVPVFVSVFDNKWLKLLCFATGLVLMVLLRTPYWAVQWCCLVAVVLVLFYNGKRGKINIKYLFYAYYPLHLAVLYGIFWLITK